MKDEYHPCLEGTDGSLWGTKEPRIDIMGILF